MTEASFTDRAYAAADSLYGEYGWPDDHNILRMLLALAWMQGNQSGSNETVKILRAEITKAAS